jgi:hypothetical protein
MVTAESTALIALEIEKIIIEVEYKLYLKLNIKPKKYLKNAFWHDQYLAT